MKARSKALAILGTGVVLFGSVACAFAFGGYRINTTPSFPLGLWQIEPLNRPVRDGDVVMICPPSGQAVELARERGYMRRGLCSSGTGPLIKRVVAVAGQSVTVDDQVAIDGEPLRSSKVRRLDGEGREMPVYAGGIVPPGNVFLHSEFVASYDSRYFGPLPTSGILGLARQVLTFEP